MSVNRKLHLITLLLLTACGGMQDNSPRASSYILSPLSGDGHGKGRMILVETPSAAPGLDSSRIALQRGSVIDYFADIKWAEPLPKVVQAALVESFESSGKFKAAGTESSGITPSVILRTEIRDFQAEYGNSGSPDIAVKIVGRVLNPSNGNVIKQFIVESEATAEANSKTAIMDAFEKAFTDAEEQILSKTSK